jgi:N-hydroxyarylamine O-acetyltransferase
VRWLVDVGFGDSTRRPLALDTAASQNDGFHDYRLVDDGADKVLERRDEGGTWQPQYRFTLQPRQLHAYADMCHYHQTAPASSFTQRLVCSQATADGRITLTHERFIHHTPAGRQERPVAGVAEFHAYLAEWFGITLTAELSFDFA